MNEYTVGFNLEYGAYVDIVANSPEEARMIAEARLDRDDLALLNISDVVHRETTVTDVLGGDNS